MSASPFLTTPKKEEVFQDIKIFNSKTPDVVACKRLLLKLLTMVNRGTELTDDEVSTVFFGLNFLFNDQNQGLKKIVYLAVKEMVQQPSFFVLTNTLLKDAKDKNETSKIDALKVIPYVIASNNPIQSEQLFRVALTDKNIAVANATIKAGYSISLTHPEHIKNCVDKIEDLLLREPGQAHYHGINVLYNIKKNDMLSFVKILLTLIKKTSSYSILTSIQLIRYCKQVLELGILDAAAERAIFEWLAKQHNRNNTVVIEVAKATVSLRNITNSELLPIISSVQMFLMSINSINVYSALKIFDKLVDNPAKSALLTSTTEIEALLGHSNKAIRSMALNILMKISREDKIVELFDKAYEMFGDLPDSIKISVIASSEEISRKYPDKTKDTIYFLWRCLRDRGEYDFKVRVIGKITQLMKKKKDLYDRVFDFFCEYIEDPFSPKLALMILNVFVENIQFTTDPRRYLRFILNRLHLDDGKIRAASITCLGEIACKVPSIRSECNSIISSYARDIDDEVRERAYYYSNLLEGKPLFEPSEEIFTAETAALIQSLIQSHNEGEGKLDLSQIVSSATQPSSPTVVSPARGPQTGAASRDPAAQVSQVRQPISKTNLVDESFANFIKNNEDFADFGPIMLSIPTTDVSDKDSEVYVRLAKHFFEEHLVLEYTIKNQDDQHDFVEVTPSCTVDDEEILQVYNKISNSRISNGAEGKIFVCLQKNPELKIAATEVKTEIKFKAQVLEGDEIANEYDDEFNCEPTVIKLSDFMTGVPLRKGEFKELWTSSGFATKQEKYKLDYKTVDAAVSQIVKHFGLSVCDNSDVLVPNSNSHSLYLHGRYLNTDPVLLQCKIGIEPKLGCVLLLEVMAEDETLRNNLADSVS